MAGVTAGRLLAVGRADPGAPARASAACASLRRYCEITRASKSRLIIYAARTTTIVKLDIAGQIVTASITNEAADELRLEAGKSAFAIVKASDVIIGVD